MSRRTLCSKRAPAYCWDLVAEVSCLVAAGMMRTLLARLARADAGAVVMARMWAPALAAVTCGEDDAGGGSGAGGGDEEVARGDGGGGDFADDVDGEAEVHEAHGGHAEGEAAAAGSGDEDARGVEDGVDGRLAWASLTCARVQRELIEDEVLVGGEAGCGEVGFGSAGLGEARFGEGRGRHNSVSLAGPGGWIKLEISMGR